jgi:hypothetical protein
VVAKVAGEYSHNAVFCHTRNSYGPCTECRDLLARGHVAALLMNTTPERKAHLEALVQKVTCSSGQPIWSWWAPAHATQHHKDAVSNNRAGSRKLSPCRKQQYGWSGVRSKTNSLPHCAHSDVAVCVRATCPMAVSCQAAAHILHAAMVGTGQ